MEADVITRLEEACAQPEAKLEKDDVKKLLKERRRLLKELEESRVVIRGILYARV